MKVKNESEVAQSCLTLCNPMDCSPSGSSIHGICQARVLASSPAISQSLLKSMLIEFMMLSDHLILCHPIFTPLVLPSLRVFSSELALHIRWPKYWSFNFRISPSSEYSGLISFRIDWFDLLAVHGTLKSLLQHHNLKASNSLALSLL